MNGRKLFTGVTALAAACALSVTGTLAYLTAKTQDVTNTFVVGGILDEDGFVKVEENQPIHQDNGTYTLNETVWVTDADYSAVLPGDTLPKNPTAKVDGLLVDAYIFIEVVDNTESISHAIASGWTELTGITGSHGGKVYTTSKLAPTDSWSKEILADNAVTVDADASGDLGSLVFYGYLCQAATFANAAAAWNACFAG